jgi:nucleotide-binding universal stress UspA family protein
VASPTAIAGTFGPPTGPDRHLCGTTGDRHHGGSGSPDLLAGCEVCVAAGASEHKEVSEMSRIVVGLDLSPSSRAALQWAAAYARLTGQPVQAVHALPVPASMASVGVLGMPAPEPADRIDEMYRRDVEDVFAAVDPLPGWRLEFYIDDPGPAVIAASDGAALVVVGTHEHKGIGRLIYGSVSRYCLSHAKVPVVAVPAIVTETAAGSPAVTDEDANAQETAPPAADGSAESETSPAGTDTAGQAPTDQASTDQEVAAESSAR